MTRIISEKWLVGWARWHIPLIPTLERLRQKDRLEFEATQSNIVSSKPEQNT